MSVLGSAAASNFGRLFQTANGDVYTGISISVNTAGNNPNDVGLFMSSNSSSWDVYSNSTALTVTDNTWHHIAIVRFGTTIRVFEDGIQQTSFTSSASLHYSSTAQSVIGGQSVGTSRSINGYIDDFRITRGYARYTGQFLSPTTSLPDY